MHSLYFDISTRQDLLLAQAHSMDGWRLNFRRSFGEEERNQWQLLLQEIDLFSPSSEPDKVSWSLEPSGQFSVRSLYQKLLHVSDQGVPKFFWAAKWPLKIKIFLWQLARGRLPAGDQLVLRHGPSDVFCVLCGALENTDHIFFSCSLACFLWSAWRQSFGVTWNPETFDQWWLIFNKLPNNAKKPVWLLFAAHCWTLWNIRNKFSIEAIFPSQPADCFFKIGLLLQQWRILSKPEEQIKLDLITAELRSLYRQTYQAPPRDDPPPS